MTGVNFKDRSNKTELLDDLNVSGNDLIQNLKELETINTYLGGNPVITEGIMKLAGDAQRLRITDLGCGGGDLPYYIHKYLSKKGITSLITGIDANPAVIEYAKARTKDVKEISYSVEDILKDNWVPPDCDLFTLSLFCHHFNKSQLRLIIKKCYEHAEKGIVINDLHRHPLAYYSIKLLTSAFSRSIMVKNDAALSVLRGFKRQELEEILQDLFPGQFSISWRWPFRFLVIINKSTPIK